MGGGTLGRRERGGPINLKVQKIDALGFSGHSDNGPAHFTAPCLFTMKFGRPPNEVSGCGVMGLLGYGVRRLCGCGDVGLWGCGVIGLCGYGVVWIGN